MGTDSLATDEPSGGGVIVYPKTLGTSVLFFFHMPSKKLPIFRLIVVGAYIAYITTGIILTA